MTPSSCSTRRSSITRHWFILVVLFACEGIAFSRPLGISSFRPTGRTKGLGTIRYYPKNHKPILQQKQQNSISSSTALRLQLRGGGTLVQTFNRFASYIGHSRARCLMLLTASIILESFATGLSKQAKDTGSVGTFVVACGVYIACMIGFNISLAKIDVSVAYALWSAFGTFLVTIAGIVFFREAVDWVKFLYIVMIVLGVVGLNLR